MRLALLVVVGMAAACATPNAVQCADGRICPGGTVCDDTHALCVMQAQVEVCEGLAEADACTAGTFTGLCDQGVCIAGCGDSVQSSGEECDDANLASHDGCSSTCLLEDPVWVEWRSPWQPRSRHSAALHRASGKLVVFGGTDEQGPTDHHWERDADTNWRRLDISRPAARQSAAIAYDEQRGIIVLFGGNTSTGILGDTWTYDGTTWTEITPPTSPSPRHSAAMAYAGNGKVVLFGGLGEGMPTTPFGHLDDTWELDGSTWTPITSATRPIARRLHTMAWAPFAGAAPDRVLLFGGVAVDDVQGLADTNDLWQYTSGTGWSVANPPGPLPGKRYAMTMAYASDADAVVMFGGGTNLVAYGDTWTYDGAAWTPFVDQIIPAARSEATLTTVGTGAVLIAGSGMTGALDDLWEFRKKTLQAPPSWSLALTPGYAPPRGEGELVYDAARRESLIVAGYREPVTVGDAFSFDGIRWRAEAPALSRYRLASAYDAAREQVVLFGGRTTATPLASTQLRTANGWRSITGSEPPPRVNGAMAYAANAQLVVLFGGTDLLGSRGDTWTFDGTTWTPRATSGPTRQNEPAMAYDPVGERLVMLDEAGATWVLDPATGWQLLVVTGSPGPRTNAAIAYSPQRKRIVVYGGIRASGTASGILTDMWELAGDSWVEVVPTGATPPGRVDPAIVAHEPLRVLLMHAGTNGSGRRLDDTWLFQFQSDTPEELCANGSDDDGDRRVDAADPDCER